MQKDDRVVAVITPRLGSNLYGDERLTVQPGDTGTILCKLPKSYLVQFDKFRNITIAGEHIDVTVACYPNEVQ